MYVQLFLDVYTHLKFSVSQQGMDEIISFWDMVSLVEKCDKTGRNPADMQKRIRSAHKLITDITLDIPQQLLCDSKNDLKASSSAGSNGSSDSSESSSDDTEVGRQLDLSRRGSGDTVLKRRYGQRLLELENLRRKLLRKFKIWEQTKVSVHHEQKQACDEFAVAAQEVTDHLTSSKEFGKEIFKLTNSPNVNCYGVLNLEQILPTPRKQFADTDLHNLKSGEALDIFRRRLNELRIFVNMVRETFYWFVVTGKGENSKNGIATIKPEVLRILKEFADRHNTDKSGVQFAEATCNEGRIDVVFYYNNNVEK